MEEIKMAKNCVGTYEQYKERLLKMKPNVYLHGQKIDRSNGKQGAERDLADWIQGGTYVMKQCQRSGLRRRLPGRVQDPRHGG